MGIITILRVVEISKTSENTFNKTIPVPKRHLARCAQKKYHLWECNQAISRKCLKSLYFLKMAKIWDLGSFKHPEGQEVNSLQDPWVQSCQSNSRKIWLSFISTGYPNRWNLSSRGKGVVVCLSQSLGNSRNRSTQMCEVPALTRAINHQT